MNNHWYCEYDLDSFKWLGGILVNKWDGHKYDFESSNWQMVSDYLENLF